MLGIPSSFFDSFFRSSDHFLDHFSVNQIPCTQTCSRNHPCTPAILLQLLAVAPPAAVCAAVLLLDVLRCLITWALLLHYSLRCGRRMLLLASATASMAFALPAPPAGGATVKLNNGLTFPLVSFGLQVYDDTTAQAYTTTALAAGFRNFFSSVLAGNQAGFGDAIKATKVPRKEIFICGSVNTGNGQCSGTAACKSATADGCSANLQAIGVPYLDMIMLDYPAGDCASIQGQWLAFEDMLKSGKTRSIAVSNFSPQQLDCIVQNKSSTAPAVNQMPYAVGSGSSTVVADNAKRGGILVQAYSPLQGGGLASDPDCVAIGKAQ